MLAETSGGGFFGSRENATAGSLHDEAGNIAENECLRQPAERNDRESIASDRAYDAPEVHVDRCRKEDRGEQDEERLDRIRKRRRGLVMCVYPNAIPYRLNYHPYISWEPEQIIGMINVQAPPITRGMQNRLLLLIRSTRWAKESIRKIAAMAMPPGTEG